MECRTWNIAQRHRNIRHSSRVTSSRGSVTNMNRTRSWMNQQITGMMSAPLMIWFIFCILPTFTMSYRECIEVLSRPFNVVLLLATWGVTMIHGFLGMRVIINDYIRGNRATKIVKVIKMSTTLLFISGSFMYLYAILTSSPCR